jgi:cbb3-type cytochrome oxidase subunit 3
MTIYYLLIAFVGLCSSITIKAKDVYKRNKIVILTSCTAIAVIQGLRSVYVGIDLFRPGGYLPALRFAKDLNLLAGEKLYNFEIGYSIYSIIFANLNVSDQLYLFIVAVTIILPIGYIWIKNSKMPGLSVFIYLTLGFFTFSFSGLRQSIALAITFLSYKFIKEKKLIQFLLCIALAMSFHKTAIIFVIAYPLYYLRIKPFYFIFLIPSLILIFLLRTKIFLLIYHLYKGVAGVTEATNAYTMLFVMIVVLALAYMFGDKNKNNLDLNAYKNYMLITIIVQIFASHSNIIMRAGFYYYIFITLLIPEVIANQRDPKIRIIAVGVSIIALLYFFQVTTGDGYLNVSPYYFYWQ